MTPADIITGVLPVNILAKLTDGSPLTYPLATATLKEATFPGYVSTVCTLRQQAPGLYGSGSCKASATFVNTSGDLFIRAKAIYLVSAADPTQLLFLKLLESTDLNVIPLGAFTVTLDLFTFVPLPKN